MLSLALLAGRLAGLVRELMLASVFGVSATADTAVLLLTLPDLLINLLISGGLSAALVPRFSSLDGHDAMVLMRYASMAVILLFSLVGVVLVAWPNLAFGLLAPGLAAPFEPGAAVLVAVALAIPLTGASGVAGAYLNAGQRYFVTGCGTLFFNLAVVAAMLLALRAGEPLLLLAFGIAAGAALRWSAQLITLPAGVWRVAARGPVWDRPLMRAFATAALSSALLLLAPLAVRAMASTVSEGAISSFNYAQKLIELPIGILITSISTVALTRLSALKAAGDDAALVRAAGHSVRHALLVAISVAAIGCWFADSIVQVLFGRGQMNQEALARVAGLTRIALLTVPFVALSSMAMARLNAVGRSARLLRPTLGSLLLLPVLALPGLYWSSEQGLMWAVVVFQAVVAIWLAWEAGYRLAGAEAVLDRNIVPYLGAVAALAVGAAACDRAFAPQNHWLRLLLAGTAFALVLMPLRRFLRATPGTSLVAP